MKKNDQIINNHKSRRSFFENFSKLFIGSVVLGSISNFFAQSKASGKLPDSTQTAADPLLGGIGLTGFNFAPRGWSTCSGQILSISQNTALFSLLGTIYGGDGSTTFALPDLRGRVAIGYGQGPGLSNRSIGERGGQESVALSVSELPSHNHNLAVNSGAGTSHTPNNTVLASNAEGIKQFAASANSTSSSSSISSTGSGSAHNNMQPYLALNYIIALQGIFPSRS